MIATDNTFVRTFVPMKEHAGQNEEDRKRRREETRQLTLRYLALKESQHDVEDMTAEEHAADIVERVQQRLAQCSGAAASDGKKECK